MVLSHSREEEQEEEDHGHLALPRTTRRLRATIGPSLPRATTGEFHLLVRPRGLSPLQARPRGVNLRQVLLHGDSHRRVRQDGDSRPPAAK